MDVRRLGLPQALYITTYSGVMITWIFILLFARECGQFPRRLLKTICQSRDCRGLTVKSLPLATLPHCRVLAKLTLPYLETYPQNIWQENLILTREENCSVAPCSHLSQLVRSSMRRIVKLDDDLFPPIGCFQSATIPGRQLHEIRLHRHSGSCQPCHQYLKHLET